MYADPRTPRVQRRWQDGQIEDACARQRVFVSSKCDAGRACVCAGACRRFLSSPGSISAWRETQGPAASQQHGVLHKATEWCHTKCAHADCGGSCAVRPPSAASAAEETLQRTLRTCGRAPVLISCVCADLEIWRRWGTLVSCADVCSLLLPFALARWYPAIMVWLALLRARSQWVEATRKNLPSRGSEMQLQPRLGQEASKCPPCPCSFPARPPCFSHVLARHWTRVLAWLSGPIDSLLHRAMPCHAGVTPIIR